MKAIEINTITDKFGHLHFDYPINKRERKVRVIILVDEKSNEIDEESLWLESVSSYPAFDFLNEPFENIYSLSDGEPIND